MTEKHENPEKNVPGTNETPPEKRDTSKEDAESKKRNEELFGDLDDEIPETPEEIKAERDELKQKLIDLSTRLGKSQQDNLALSKQLTTQKTESAAAITRTQNQFEEQKAFALEKFIKELLPVVDNLERGLGAIPAASRAADPKFEKLAQGVEKTLGQLAAVFNKFGVKEINPKGETFDPDKHEAISTDDSADVESDTVVGVAQKGYSLNDRVIRPAKVIVKP